LGNLLAQRLAELLQGIIREALIWRQLQHPNVLPLLCLHHWDGVYPHARIALVSPRMINGNAREFLCRESDIDRVSLVSLTLSTLSTRELIVFSKLLDVAEGLHYLHSMRPTIIHGDLKAVRSPLSFYEL
jgi:serine/threonine protein kinase